MTLNNEDRIEVAKSIAQVRRTGKVNMFDRRGVITLMYMIGDDFSADYLANNPDEYMKLLELSGTIKEGK